MKTLNEMMDFAQIGATNIIKNTGQEVQPMFFGETVEGEGVLIQAYWGNTEEKDKALETVKKTFAERKVVRYVHVSEAWMVAVPKGQELTVPPSQSPDRVEVLVIGGADTDGTTVLRSFKIQRGTDQPLVPYENFHPGDQAKGKMFDLIEKEKKVLH